MINSLKIVYYIKKFLNYMEICLKPIELSVLINLRLLIQVDFLILGTVLICTDVASRGLDFKDVNNTIIMDMPDSFTDYAHKIGRTARIDKPGTSLLMLFFKELKFKERFQKHKVVEIYPNDAFERFKKNYIK